MQIQQLKSTIESLHKEVSEFKSCPKDTTDLPSSVQEPQDGISQANTDLSTESINSRSVQVPTTTGFKKTESKIYYDDRKFNIVIYMV